MKLEIEIISHTLIGSGEGTGIIDSDVVFDDFGIPYIPSRRIKGIIKESSYEVCEMLGIDEKILHSIWGRRGFEEGKVRIGNLYIKDYDIIKEEIKNLKEKKEVISDLISSESLKNYFTTIRYQTAIENGVAKEHSLRTLRVLKPGITFIGEISEINSFTESELALLYLSIINLSRIGTSRNRGLGEVKSRIVETDLNTEKAIALLKNQSTNKQVVSDSTNHIIPFENSGDDKIMSYYLKVLSPVVISSKISDENTINTERYIPSMTIRGLFASNFIKKLNLRDAHKNDLFYDLFLKCNLLFTPAFPYNDKITYYPSPLFLHKKKGERDFDNLEIYNIFETQTQLKTKPLHYFINFDEDGKIQIYNPSTVFFFHNARERVSGRSSEKEGAIFYYEALKEGEVFKGYLIAKENTLKSIKNIFGEKFVSYIGRSKSAQYGEVEIEFGEIEDINSDIDADEEFIIWTISPIILTNNEGFSSISVKNLESYLANFLGADVIIEDIIAKEVEVENYIGVWKMKTPRQKGFSPGSVFKVKTKNCNNLQKKLFELQEKGIGEKTNLGFGRIKIIDQRSPVYKIKMIEKKSEKSLDKISMINNILIEILKQKYYRFFEYKGFEEAKYLISRRKQITKHLIGRLENMILESENWDEWIRRLNSIEKKQAGEKLKSAKIWDKLCNKDIIDSLYEDRDFLQIKKQTEFIKSDFSKYKFDFFKTYMLSFLRNLRLLLKKEE